MTTEPPPTIQTTSESFDEYDTTAAEAEAEPAEAPPPQQPAIQDPRDECVLCTYPLPLKHDESFYYS